jgi:hypothetical protein
MKRIFRTGGAWRVLCAAAVSVGLLPAPLNAHAESGRAPRTIRLAIPPDAPVGEARPRSEFRAKTEGSPQPTIVGGWRTDASASNESHLTFAGGHAIGGSTTFFGTWISPASTSSKAPSMTIEYDLNYANTLGTEIPIVQAVRARFAGGKWGRWAKANSTIPATESAAGSGTLSVLVPLTEPRRVQFQWKITGAVSAPALLAGDFRLNVG